MFFNYLGQSILSWGGLEDYINSQGYNFDGDGDIYSWTIDWGELKDALDKGEPAIALLSNKGLISGLEDWIFDLNTRKMGHATVCRGYWSNQRIVLDFGWGRDKVKTIYGQPLTNAVFQMGKKADFSYVNSGNIITYPEVEIIGIVRFWPTL